MPEDIRLYIKTSPDAFRDPHTAPTMVEGIVMSPDWRDGQERQLDSDIYWALRDCDITTFHIYVNHEYEHDTGATGLEAWEVVLHIAEQVPGVAQGIIGTLIVTEVLPRLIRIFKPGRHLEGAEAQAVEEEANLDQARESAIEYLKSYSGPEGEERLKETVATPFGDDHYLFNFAADTGTYFVIVGKKGGQVVSSVLVRGDLVLS